MLSLVTLILASTLTHAASPQKEIKLPGDCGDVIYRFDPKAISEKELRGYLAYAPLDGNTPAALVHSLEMCIEDDPAYSHPCGSRDWNAAHFQKNAAVNLSHSRKKLAAVGDALKTARSAVKPFLEAFKAQGDFFLSLEEARARFLATTQDMGALKTKIGDMDPAAVASEAIKKIGAAATPFERYRLVSYDWHNAINKAYQDAHPDQSQALWEKFLTATQIKVIRSDNETCD